MVLTSVTAQGQVANEAVGCSFVRIPPTHIHLRHDGSRAGIVTHCQVVELTPCRCVPRCAVRMPHSLIQTALLWKGASCHNVGLYMQELAGLEATITIPQVGETSSRCLKNGSSFYLSKLE